MSSAQVLRNLQQHFRPSALFQPWLEAEQARLEQARQPHQKPSRKSKRPLEVKLGHGGTLDPMATGVLIVGVGAGTKSLDKFLGCTKSYDAVLLFGTATDTFDTLGKVVARKGFEHVTKEVVEEALGRFRGEIMQRPPIYSALRVQGKRLYEYARQGKEVPVEIQERPVEVKSLELLEWMEGGSHDYQWALEQAGKEDRVVADKLLDLQGNVSPEPDIAREEETGMKRKREEEAADGTVEHPPPAKRSKDEDDNAGEALPDDQKPSGAPEPTVNREPCPAPACRIRMTVTSGFYVRSLCHDLGATVGSLGTMAALVRTRQGDYALGQNVFKYDDLAEGENVWAPKIRQALDTWNAEKSVVLPDPVQLAYAAAKAKADRKREKRSLEGRRRNTSSPEDD